MKEIASDLRSYDDTQNHQIIETEKLIQIANDKNDSKEVERLEKELEKLHTEKIIKAQQALIWVADNLPKLWD